MGINYMYLALSVGGTIAGAALALLLSKKNDANKIIKAEKTSKKLMKEAKAQAQRLVQEALKESDAFRNNLSSLETEAEEQQQYIQERIKIREEKAQKRESRFAQKEEVFKGLYSDLEGLESKYKEASSSIKDGLRKKSGYKDDDAKQEIKNALDREFADFVESYPAKKERLVKDNSAKASINMLQGIIEKYTQPSSVDRLSKTVYLTRLADKERIIGKDFENLRHLESITEVDIIFNDTPKHVTVSHFVLVKQEIARLTIMNLLGLRKVTPKIIDEAFAAAKEEMDQTLLEIGTEAADTFDLENRDPELLKLIGRLKYRTSYGQNILYHSYEIAYFCAMMAAEIGAYERTAMLAGFFHDLGKAIDQEDGRTHDVLSKELLEKFGFSEEIVHAAWAHHDGEPQRTPEAHIVIAADKLSSGRPGARSETAEQYVERIQSLEKIAIETPGVIKAYAISAGREMRIYLDEKAKKDNEMPEIADSIAQEIEENVTYPGKIKVNLIRIFKAVDFANKKSKSK